MLGWLASEARSDVVPAGGWDTAGGWDAAVLSAEECHAVLLHCLGESGDGAAASAVCPVARHAQLKQLLPLPLLPLRDGSRSSLARRDGRVLVPASTRTRSCPTTG